MVRSDLLDSILPEAPEAVRRRARRVTTYLRLLTDDARPRAPSPVSINLERATHEYAAHARRRAARALLELARRHVRAVLGAASFVELGAADPDEPEPWSVLESLRRERGDVPHVPAPGESALLVAARMVAALRELDPEAARLGEAWLARARSGPAAGAEAFEALESSSSESLARTARRARIECWLDRGAVGRASELLALVPPDDLARDRRLAWIAVWVPLLAGDEDEARRRAAGRAPYDGPIPSALAELRERRPEWVRWLAGRLRVDEPHAAPAALASTTTRREDLGAAFLGVFAFHPDRGAQPIFLDVAPALRERLDEALFERADAHAVPGELEHRVVVEAAPHVAHRGIADDERALRGALDPERTRAVAVTPILDEEREVVGWLRLETCHHLLPARERLERLAQAWRSRLGSTPPPAERLATSPSADRTSVRARTFADWVATLSMKTAQRRWWGFVVDAHACVPVADGGGALADTASGGRRALGRAIASRGTVAFSERSPALSVSADAASGVVVPLVLRDRVTGLFVVESARRRDFRPADVERLGTAAQRFAPRLRLAEFRDWHVERFGTDVVLDCDDTPFGRRALDFVAAGRARGAVAISGPPGCGKEILARWLHFESGCPEEPFAVLPAGAINARPERLERALEALVDERGTCVVDDVTALAPDGQARLLAHLVDEEGAARRGALEPRGRIAITSSRGLEQALAEGLVQPDLGRRLQRLELVVPPLDRRREEIPRLVAVLARRFADEEGVAVPRFPDETLAWLWRQPWPGDVRELGDWIYKLTILHAGRSVGPEALVDFAERFGLKLLRRIPSRHPDREDLRAALRTTLTGRGTLNKTRAAAYLGWDPDTLVARLRDCGWPDEFSIEARRTDTADATDG